MGSSIAAEHVLRPDLPDGRLAQLVCEGPRRLSYRYDERYVRPELLPSWREWGRHFRHSGLFVPHAEGSSPGAPGIEVWLERVSDESLPLSTAKARCGWVDGKPFLEVACRASLVAPELIVQMNEIVLPQACGMLCLVTADADADADARRGGLSRGY